jgi:hypothetical protein
MALTHVSSVYSTDIGGDVEEEDDGDNTMHIPRVMANSMPVSGKMAIQQQLLGHVNGNEADAALDLPPMKDMTIPFHRRESIRMEQFLTPEYADAHSIQYS